MLGGNSYRHPGARYDIVGDLTPAVPRRVQNAIAPIVFPCQKEEDPFRYDKTVLRQTVSGLRRNPS